MRYLTNDLDANGIPTWAESDAELSPYSGPAARFWDFETDDMSGHGLEMLVRVVTTPHGTFRACVRQDEYPDAPEDEFGDPVNRIPSGSWPKLGEVEYGTNEHAGVDIREVWGRLYRGDGRYTAVDLVDRYLRIFHGGAARMLSSTVHRGGDDFLVWTTQARREALGADQTPWTGDDLKKTEWQDYLDNEVYVISVERQVLGDVSDEPEWEEVDDFPVGGFYGQSWAIQAAEDELHSVIEHRAGQMLPLT